MLSALILFSFLIFIIHYSRCLKYEMSLLWNGVGMFGRNNTYTLCFTTKLRRKRNRRKFHVNYRPRFTRDERLPNNSFSTFESTCNLQQVQQSAWVLDHRDKWRTTYSFCILNTYLLTWSNWFASNYNAHFRHSSITLSTMQRRISSRLRQKMQSMMEDFVSRNQSISNRTMSYLIENLWKVYGSNIHQINSFVECALPCNYRHFQFSKKGCHVWAGGDRLFYDNFQVHIKLWINLPPPNPRLLYQADKKTHSSHHVITATVQS